MMVNKHSQIHPPVRFTAFILVSYHLGSLVAAFNGPVALAFFCSIRISKILTCLPWFFFQEIQLGHPKRANICCELLHTVLLLNVFTAVSLLSSSFYITSNDWSILPFHVFSLGGHWLTTAHTLHIWNMAYLSVTLQQVCCNNCTLITQKNADLRLSGGIFQQHGRRS